LSPQVNSFSKNGIQTFQDVFLVTDLTSTDTISFKTLNL